MPEMGGLKAGILLRFHNRSGSQAEARRAPSTGGNLSLPVAPAGIYHGGRRNHDEKDAPVTASASAAMNHEHLALAVRIGEHRHAVPIAAVEEVLPALAIETVPQCPGFIRGVISVRGRLIPVLDAAERLGLAHHPRPAEPHIVCLRIGERLLGLEVDEALDLVDLQPGVRVTADELGARPGFFAGAVELDGQIIRLLEPRLLLTETESAELDNVPQQMPHGD